MLNDIKKWHKVALRISGDLAPIEQIGELLNLRTTYCNRKGDYPHGNSGYRPYPTNIWVHEVESKEDVPFEEQIPTLLAAIESRREDFLQLLSLPGVTAELFLGFGAETSTEGDFWTPSQGSVLFSPHLMERLSKLSLYVSLDLYPTPSNDPDMACELGDDLN